MTATDIIRQRIPGIITGFALKYPVTHIRSVSFYLKKDLVAACFWDGQSQNNRDEFSITESDPANRCCIYKYGHNILECDVELYGFDEKGNAIVILMPVAHIRQVA